MEKYELRQILNLLDIHFQDLLAESKEEGFGMLTRLLTDYYQGENTFNEPCEALYGVFNKAGHPVAIGGLNIDPFSNEERIGRVRRFYVSKHFRREGIGTMLLEKIIADARNNFVTLVLHTETDSAAAFYINSGFIQDDCYPNSTHSLQLK